MAAGLYCTEEKANSNTILEYNFEVLYIYFWLVFLLYATLLL